MKILEAQSALLSNYEVYQHIVDQQKRSKAHKRRMPGNLATLMTEVLTYLREKPGPLAKQEETGVYDQTVISRLLEKLREENFQSDLAKGELLTILNLRPSNTAILSTVIEDMEDRFTDEEQGRIVDIIAEVLGRDEPAEEEADGEDENAMPSIESGN